MQGCLVFIVLVFLMFFVMSCWYIILPVVAVIFIYSSIYFKSTKFDTIKKSISSYVSDCNDLNSHIGDLRASYINIRKTDYGEVSYSNVGKNNYKRKAIANAKYSPTIYDCSRSVFDSARKQPFKYICKYFNIKEDETHLEQFEEILNNFAAAEEGKELSRRKYEEIMNTISKDIPWLIRKLFPKKLNQELGVDELFFPVFSFRYISPGGNSGTQFDLAMDLDMLERFIHYLSEKVKFKKSMEGQRRLMTPKLRKYIIDRDKYTCQQCKNSIENEPNLLLEVDHIIPISKGGITEENNLQTLCWKCNRHKGAKIKA